MQFLRGFAALGAATLPAATKALPKLAARAAAPDAADNFHMFAFNYCLTEPGQRIVDVATAAAMLELAAPPGARHLRELAAFFRVQTDAKVVTRDQWEQCARFSREVAADLSNADDNPAWPVLLDAFVEHARAARAGAGGEK